MDKTEIIKRLRDRFQNEKGITIGLIGPLGAGKTDLVKQLMESVSLEFADQVVSPTYSLCCEYLARDLVVHHFDLYRIESEEDLYDIDVFGSMGNPSILTFVEWIDMFPSLYRSCDLLVKISIMENQERDFELGPPNSSSGKINTEV